MRVFAVPRSIARSFEKIPRIESRIIARATLQPPFPHVGADSGVPESPPSDNEKPSAAGGLQSRGASASFSASFRMLPYLRKYSRSRVLYGFLAAVFIA